MAPNTVYNNELYYSSLSQSTYCLSLLKPFMPTIQFADCDPGFPTSSNFYKKHNFLIKNFSPLLNSTREHTVYMSRY